MTNNSDIFSSLFLEEYKVFGDTQKNIDNLKIQSTIFRNKSSFAKIKLKYHRFYIRKSIVYKRYIKSEINTFYVSHNKKSYPYSIYSSLFIDEKNRLLNIINSILPSN